MPEELLQRMRDIHYPDAPGWFPPAPGWWLLAVLLIAVLVWLAFRIRARKRKRAPYATALRLLNDASERESRGELPTRDYLDLCNQLLKRVLVHVRHNKTAVAASGEEWLRELDQLHGGNQFTKGPGKVLGNLRFAPVAPTAAPGLDRLLNTFIKKLQKKTEDSEPANDSQTSQNAGVTG